MKSRTLIHQNIINNDSLNNEFLEIDIEKTAEKLVKCGNNRTEFQTYINRINNIVLGDENVDVINKDSSKQPIESKNSFYKSIYLNKLGDRSNSKQFMSKGSINQSIHNFSNNNQRIDNTSHLKSYEKSPNSKMYVMEDNSEKEDQKSVGSFKLANRSSLKNSKVYI